ncbi:AraC family transcriptional regulator [Parahaliea aestuarii]|uniref:AraC family transcriptional regulator n=1 Tax=Parahaliea aestuarii TaxID=1852021 RepID=A0A5C8ZT80_9GAMM|nr:AraC family transcriptional regulator [Parahaliea aestuarii]TXS90979.1 AraC family transcriptional regulator [Parahaliea aestuarii]
MNDSHQPRFWRDARMPQVELRKVADGREVCYALHSHRHWSLGAITGGRSTFLYRDQMLPVSEGALVLMNPEWPHACNPVDNEPWSYLMLYVDTGWLCHLRHACGLLPGTQWRDIATAVVTDPALYRGYCALADCLLDTGRELLDKQTQLVEYLSDLMFSVDGGAAESFPAASAELAQVAAYLDAHCTQDLSLDDLCALSGYSQGHLIRSFRRHFGMTPHAYLLNRRVQYGQRQLKNGLSIAATAHAAGFADQAHFQRTFKRLVAATPCQYRGPSEQEQKTARRQ